MLKLVRKAAAAGIAALAMLAMPVLAQDAGEGYVTYTVKSNDTLYHISQRYLLPNVSPMRLAEINRVRNPRRLQINSTLRIPRELLRFERVDLRVANFSGPVFIDNAPATPGAVLDEGQVITTRRNGFVTFTSAFGGRISLPSNTSARLLRARRYVFGNTLDVDFQVTNGRATTTSPPLQGDDRLRMRTPDAVTAVRGTEFRIAYASEGGAISLTEVTEGSVNVAAGGEEGDAGAGFGIASSAEGVGAPEELLPAPRFDEGGAIQTGETLDFALTPIPGARAYRVQLSEKAGLIDAITETIVETPEVSLPGLDNGRYYIRARAISESGLEGFTEEFSFRRKRLGVEASVEAGDDGYRFGWLTSGEGPVTYSFQLWREGASERLLIDEIGLEVTELVLTDLARDRYQWRVAVVQPDEEAGLLRVWGPVNTLVVSE